MRFLSPEWLDRLAAATSTASTDATLTVHQRVTGGPNGDVEYVLRVAGGGVRVEPGPPAGAVDVSLTTDYPTAAAISRGLLSPADAFAAGRMRVGGTVGALVANQEALARLGHVLAGVAEATTY